MSSAFIARGDGLQNTLLISENVDAGNYTDQQKPSWVSSGTAPAR